MVVDARALMTCNLGRVLRGQIGDSLITDGGLITTTGTLEIEGLTMPDRCTPVELAYYQPQKGTITRFPRRLRVLRATADPYRYKTTVEVGCLLALQQSIRTDGDAVERTITSTVTTESTFEEYLAAYPPITAQSVLTYCLSQIGITRATGSEVLAFQFYVQKIDVSSGYVSVINDLIKSECCYGRINMDEQLMIQKIDLSAGTTGAVLSTGDLIDLQPIGGNDEPASRVVVSYGR